MQFAWLLPAVIVVVTVAAMELVANVVHRHVMHGPGWRLHRSHHRTRTGLVEANDLYALLFAALSIALFVLGSRLAPLWWIGMGMVLYGILYTLLHDALVHRRIPFPRPPRSGYLKRLVQAHRIHHSVTERDGAVSFGFLYAPPVAKLVARARAVRTADQDAGGPRP